MWAPVISHKGAGLGPGLGEENPELKHRAACVSRRASGSGASAALDYRVPSSPGASCAGPLQAAFDRGDAGTGPPTT